jgi:hypothetical protein
MNRLNNSRIIAFLILIFLGSVYCEGQGTNKSGLGPAPKKGIFGLFHRKGTVQRPKSVGKIKREQEKKDKKKQQEYVKAVKQNQQRSYEIQTPEVKARMKQNQKDITEREKARKKKESASSKKVKKKYK